MENTSTRLRIVIEHFKLTQADFAESIGTTPATLSRQLKGVHKIDKQVALSVQAVYGVNYSWLLTGEGEMFLTSPPSPLLKERGEESSKVMQSDAPRLDENDMAKPTSQKKQNGLSGVNGGAEIFEGEINHVRWFMELPRDTQTLILAAAELEDMDVIKQGRDFFLFAVQMQRTKKQMLEAGSELALRKKGEAG